MKSISQSLRNAKKQFLRRKPTTSFALGAVVLMSLVLATTTGVLTQDALAARGLDSEKIDLRAHAITVTIPGIGTVTGYHLFILYTDKAGT